MDKKKNTMNQQDHTLIGSSTVLKGDVQSEGDLRIDGTVEGNIISNGRLVVGEGAKIKGNLRCKSSEIYGNIVGDVHCDDVLVLKSSANIEGSIKLKRIVVEDGANLNVSTIDMRGDNHRASMPQQPQQETHKQ